MNCEVVSMFSNIFKRLYCSANLENLPIVPIECHFWANVLPPAICIVTLSCIGAFWEPKLIKVTYSFITGKGFSILSADSKSPTAKQGSIKGIITPSRLSTDCSQ